MIGPSVTRGYLAAFTATVLDKTPPQQLDAIRTELLEVGGRWIEHDPDEANPALVEVSLHGILGVGTTIDDAVSNWIEQASAHLEAA
jgi:hypothetical protein